MFHLVSRDIFQFLDEVSFDQSGKMAALEPDDVRVFQVEHVLDEASAGQFSDQLPHVLGR
jgi:hypothetical protein